MTLPIIMIDGCSCQNENQTKPIDTSKPKTSIPHLTDPQKTNNQLPQVNTSFEQKDTYFKDPFVFEIHIKFHIYISIFIH